MTADGTASEAERRRQRDRFLLLIVACVAGIYGLCGLSWLLAPERDEAPPVPATLIDNVEADLRVAGSLLGAGEAARAAQFLERARARLEHLDAGELTPAQAVRIERLRERLRQLSQQPADRLGRSERAAQSGDQ